jgi:superfamily II RNA helicase
MPARTVCFHSLEKFDGMNFRFLNSKEYFQLAGRAGRRGIDTEGLAIALVERKTFDADKVENFTSKDTDPIISQFKLSYNTVINLMDKHTKDEQEVILKSSFDYYLKKKGGHQIRIMSTYNHMVDRLKKMGYISKENKVTEKGRFATHIYSNELLITELFCSPLYRKFTDLEMTVILASIVYEERLMDKFKHGDKKTYFHIVDTLSENPYAEKNLNFRNVARMNKIVTMWFEGRDFAELLDYTSIDEGDIIRIFRQIIDLYRQILRATTDHELTDKIEKCIKIIQRDVVKVEF